MKAVRFFTRSMLRSIRSKESGWVIYYMDY